VLLVPGVIWVMEDRAVWPWDQAWYGEVSTDLWFWMGHSLLRWAGEMAGGLYMKPPGAVWLGQLFVPLRHVFGTVERSLLVSILATQFVVLAIIFRIGRRLGSGSYLVAVCGVVLAAGGSLFVGLSHQFFVEPLQAAAVAWVYCVAVEAPGWTSPRIALQLALALVVGALAKADTPLYCTLPCVYAAVLIWRKKPTRGELSACWRSRGFRVQVALLGLVAVPTALWYYRNLATVWQHARDASLGADALHYGTRDTWLHKLTMWWRSAGDSFLSPYLGWVFLAVLAAAVLSAVLRFRKRTNNARIEAVSILSLLQVLLILSVLSKTITVEPRFLYAVLPSIAIVFVQLCALLPARFLAAVVVACGAQWAAVNAESLALVGRFDHQSQWLITPERDGSRYDDLARVVSLTSDVPARYDVIAVESPWMNANAAAFFAAKNRLRTGGRCYYTSLGYAETDFGAAMRRIETFRTHYVITLAEPFQSGLADFLNVVSLPVLRDMQSDLRFRQVPFASRNGVLVFRFQSGFTGTGAGSTH
jgi:hypothetical protein